MLIPFNSKDHMLVPLRRETRQLGFVRDFLLNPLNVSFRDWGLLCTTGVAANDNNNNNTYLLSTFYVPDTS